MLDLTKQAGENRWRGRQQEAAALGAALAIEAIAGAGGAGLQDLAAALSGSEVDVARVLVFADGEMVTDETVLTAAREAFAQAGVETLVGGGTRAFFTELNRATLPLDEMEVVSYTLNPQVHAFDNASMTETLAAQPETVRSARAIVGDRPLVVGPITLRPRFNPNATGPEPKPGPGELPSSVDYRQPSLFAAGWLAGASTGSATPVWTPSRTSRRPAGKGSSSAEITRCAWPGSIPGRGWSSPSITCWPTSLSSKAGRSCRSRSATGSACRRWRCAMATGCASSWRT